MSKAIRQLSQGEHAALRAYALVHGRAWKAALRAAWMEASEPGVLQGLRNAAYFGPRGLAAYTGEVTRWTAISPDGLAIEGKTYRDEYEATKALVRWCQRFPGYYAAADGRRIPVSELAAACRVVEAHTEGR